MRGTRLGARVHAPLPRRKKEDDAVAKSVSLSDQIISPVHLHSQFLHRLTATKPYHRAL